MYNLKDRSYFTTLGELRMLLNDFADEVTVCVGGSLGAYLHVKTDDSIISFDDEDLSDNPDAYPAFCGYDDCVDELYQKRKELEYSEHQSRLRMLFEDNETYDYMDY